MSFRNLVILAVVALFLRGFVAGPCEPCFLAGLLAAAIIVRRFEQIRKTVGVLILVIACTGLFFDIKNRINEQLEIHRKVEHIRNLQTNTPSPNRTNARGVDLQPD